MKKITLLLFIILPSLLFAQTATTIIEDNFEGTNNETYFTIYAPTAAPSNANQSTLATPTINNSFGPGNKYMTNWIDAGSTASANYVKMINTTGVTSGDGAARISSATALSLVMDIVHPGTNTSYIKPTGDIRISTTFSGTITSSNLYGQPRTGFGILVGFYDKLTSKYALNTTDQTKYGAVVSTSAQNLNKFRGFVINPDTGRIVLWKASSTSSDTPSAPFKVYAGNSLGEPWVNMAQTTPVAGNLIKHTLSYTINATTGAVYNFVLDGVFYDWSSETVGLFSDPTFTDYVGLGISSATAKDAYFHSLLVENVAGQALTTMPTTSWDGASWDNGTPDNTKKAVINGILTIPSGSIINANSVEVGSTGTLTVQTGGTLIIANNITNTNSAVDTVVIESGANLIQTNQIANTGNISVKRNSAPLKRLDHTLWSSPVTNAGFSLGTFSPQTLTNRFYIYNASTNSYVADASTNQFQKAKGYAVRAPDNFTTTPTTFEGKFIGVPNNGYYVFGMPATTTASFHLTGNPYPSAIDANLFIAANGVAPGANKIAGTLYFYAHTLTMNPDGTFPAGTNYALWNSTGSTAATGGVVPSGIIKPGQGFFVKAVANTAQNVVFNNTMRLNNTADTQFFKTKATTKIAVEEKNRLWLNLTNETGTEFNQMLIGYVAGATAGIDNNYDGESFGDTTTALSSKIEGAAGIDYTIQGRALPFSPDDVVSLGFKAAIDGKYTISLSAIDGLFLGSQDVFIKDKNTGKEQNLKTAPYTFTAIAGVDDARFSLIFAKTLGVSDTTFDKTSVAVFKKEGAFQVNTNGIMMKEISVFDVQGRLIFKQSAIDATTSVLKISSQANGVLLFKIVSQDNKTVTIKAIN